MKRIHLLCLVLAFLAVPSLALADSISPASLNLTLGVGGSVTIPKTVTITKDVTTALVDIVFLSDTTGSMFGLIDTVQTNAAAILTGTAGFGDVRWGVAEYRDVGDAFVWRVNQDLTSSQAAVQAAIAGWVAGGGGDTPEANFPALKGVADTISWRALSNRIVVWFGDAPGHDPRDGVSMAQAIAALNAKNVIVEAANLAGPGAGIDFSGQASAVVAATGGTLFNNFPSGDIVQAIKDAIGAAFATYKTVSLGLSDVPAGVTVTYTPGSYVGAFDRSVDRTFMFDVTFTLDTGGSYSFPIYALVDGRIVATERDTINGVIPEPSTFALLGLGLLGFGLVARRRKS